jgi:hypothetical protein
MGQGSKVQSVIRQSSLTLARLPKPKTIWLVVLTILKNSHLGKKMLETPNQP